MEHLHVLEKSKAVGERHVIVWQAPPSETVKLNATPLKKLSNPIDCCTE
jgi:hypothetical protein